MLDIGRDLYAAFVRELDGVAEQIIENLLQPVFVCQNQR